MHKVLWIIFAFMLGGRLLSAGAETYSMADGSSLTGEVIKYDDVGVFFQTTDYTYTNLAWTRFSQDGLKLLAQNPKLTAYVEPFIIPPPAPRVIQDLHVQTVARLQPPPKMSVLGALFSSSVGLFILLAIYLANLIAAMEVAHFRSRPVGMVAGLAAVLPILVPIIFLALPSQGEAKAEAVEEEPAAPAAPARAQAAETPPPPQPPAPRPPAPAPTPTPSISAAPMRPAPAAAPAPRPPAPQPAVVPMPASTWEAPAEEEKPSVQVFRRGQFMFNRRFFETKFAGFFGSARKEADKNLVLLVKTPNGQIDVRRITRIAANDVHFEIEEGAGLQEVMVPFADIQEIQVKHKEA